MNILGMVKEFIGKSIDVSVTAGTKGKYDVLATDVTESVTKGWSLLFQPELSKAGNLYYQRNNFAEVYMTNFSSIQQLIGQVIGQYMSGQGTEVVNQGTQYAKTVGKYELNGFFFYVQMNQNSLGITMYVRDENSPFYNMTVDVTMVNDKNTGQPYMVGFNNKYDTATDTLKEFNASMLPKSRKVIRINSSKNGDTAKLSIMSQIGQDEYALNRNQAGDFIQDIGNSENRAMASLYERVIMDIAFARAKEQGLPQLPSYSASANFGVGGNWSFGMQQPQQPTQPQQQYGQQGVPQQFGQQNQQFGQYGQPQQTMAPQNPYQQNAQQFGNAPMPVGAGGQPLPF